MRRQWLPPGWTRVEPDGIRNGSKINERIIRTNSKTGKNDLEYSTIVNLKFEAAPPSSDFCQMNLSKATTTPDKSVNTVSINARLMLKRTSTFQLAINPQDSQKCFLRDFYRTNHLHATLTGFLFFQQFSFSSNVTTITFRGDILAQCFHCATRDNLCPDRSLNRHIKHLPRNQLAHFLNQIAATCLSIATVHNN